jgi:5-methyltetrahydrofolate--homocysteine methyltransferase
MLRGMTSLPLWVKANAGMPQIVCGKVAYPLSAEQYASFVPALIDAGVDVIGGCCGTDPGFIREVAGKIAGRRQR